MQYVHQNNKSTWNLMSTTIGLDVWIGPRYKKSCLIQIVNLDLLFFVKKGKR